MNLMKIAVVNSDNERAKASLCFPEELPCTSPHAKIPNIKRMA